MKTFTSLRVIPVALTIALSGARATAALPELQSLIDRAETNAVVVVPAGTWKEPLVINKPLTLRGASAAASILDVTSDQPAVRITSKGPVVLEQLKVRWQRASSAPAGEAIGGVVCLDSLVTMRAIRFEAPGGATRCPTAVNVLGLSKVLIEQCHFEGFDFTVQFSRGAEGRVADSVVWKPGHAGITAGDDSSVEVTRCVVAGSGYHGIRCTGGHLKATDNLVIGNKNRGFYLGNKNAAGTIRNNVIHNNGTGISGFAQSEVEVVHNLISKSEFAGLDARDTCRLRVHRNLFMENSRALVLFKESGESKNTLQPNLSWANKTEAENFAEPPQLIQADPKFKDAANGDFAPTNTGLPEGHGLDNPGVLKGLWSQWAQLNAP